MIFQFGCHGNPKWPPKMADINVKFYKMASTHMNVQVTDGYCISFLAQAHILIFWSCTFLRSPLIIFIFEKICQKMAVARQNLTDFLELKENEG